MSDEHLIDQTAPILETSPETVTPTTTSETPTPEPEKTVSMPQSKLNELISSRLASVLKREAKQAEELTRLREIAAGSAPDASELEKTRALLADERLRASAAEKHAEQQEKAVLQSRLSASIDAVDAASVSKLLADSLTKKEGKWIVIDDETGAERLNPDGSAQTPEQAYSIWASAHPWAIRGRTIPGTGATGSTGSIPPPQVPLEYYFGPKSNSAAVNKLSLTRPDEYARLRREAVKKGLI
jgi:hypothetical protein